VDGIRAALLTRVAEQVRLGRPEALDVARAQAVFGAPVLAGALGLPPALRQGRIGVAGAGRRRRIGRRGHVGGPLRARESGRRRFLPAGVAMVGVGGPLRVLARAVAMPGLLASAVRGACGHRSLLLGALTTSVRRTHAPALLHSIKTMTTPPGWVRAIGKVGETVARHTGGMGILTYRTFAALLSGQVSLREFSNQLYQMGVQSLPLVIVTSILSGVVTSQQGGYQFTGSIPLYVLGSVVTSSVVLELGPVLTAVVVIGRVGARITAEIGTMQVSEQIDALYSLGRDPVKVLAAPRILAGMPAMILLVGIANLVGLLAGMVSARLTVGLGHATFLYGARLFWHNYDMFYSEMKAWMFGFIIPLISVHMGLLTRGGAEGVGRSTTASVVFMIIAVLVADAMFPPLFLN
jgi:phospholipid/cholesterol/gamma-HCH transport system permease protein